MESLEVLQQSIQHATGATLQIDNNALRVDRNDLVKVAQFLKEDPSTRMDYVSSLTGVDYKEALESVYHLYSIEKKEGPIILKVRVTQEDPQIPSLTPLYRGAEFQEREAYDMFGIVYTGHPDLRRILMWDEFEHYPLRKDYVPEDQDKLES